MTRTDTSRFIADLQEMHERSNRNLMQMITDLSDQVREIRLSQDRLSQELIMLQSSIKTTAIVEESKLWRQWAQAAIAAQNNSQKEQMDRMLTMFGMMGMQGPQSIYPPLPAMPTQQQALLMQQRAMQQYQEQQQQQQHQQLVMQLQVLQQAQQNSAAYAAPTTPSSQPLPAPGLFGLQNKSTPTAQPAVQLPKATVSTPMQVKAPAPTLVQAPAKPIVEPPKTTTTTTTAAPAPPKEEPQGFGDAWKPKPGSWECKGCYIRNNAEVATCPSCGTNKDGTAGKPDPFAKAAAAPKPAAPTSSFSFGFTAPKETKPEPTKAPAPEKPATTTTTEAPKPSFSFKGFGSGTTTSTTTTTAAAASPAAAPAKNLFSFTPNASASPTPAASTTAAPVSKPTFSFTTAANASSPTTGAPATENKVFGGFRATQPMTFQSSAGTDIFAGKQSSASCFGDPKAFKFGQAKPEAHAQGESPSTSRPEKDEDADEEYEPDAHFEPVIPLPSLVEVKTGEEEEEVLFSERGRLYRFLADTKEYKERGTGDIKILRHPTTNRYRVVMRREQVLKLCANFSLVPGMKAVSRQDGKPTCTFTATDFAEDPAGELLTLTVRFRTEDNRNRFVELFDQGVEAAVARQAQAPQDEEEQQEESADKQDDEQEEEEAGFEDNNVFELEVTATLAEAYPSPLRPAKVLKDTRMLLKCVYEDLPGVGPVYHIYFHNAATKKVEFSHFVRDEISLVDKDEGVSYSATNPEGVTYNVDITFDCADDDDAFRDNFHDGVVLLEGEGEEDEEEYEDYEGHEEYDE